MSNSDCIIKKIAEDKYIMYSWFEAMYTRFDIVLIYNIEQDTSNIIEKIKNEIIRLELIANRFLPESELFFLNENAGKQIKVSEELFYMIDYCIRYNEYTYGYFDITVNSKPFVKDNIKSVKLFEDNSIQFLNENIRIDLNGYLKGYALDKIKNILTEENITDALLNFGNSSIMALGNHPNGNGWKISPQNNMQEVLLYNECYTTSGNEISTRKHILNPLEGKYIEGEKTISVITKKAADGEIFSTALFAADNEIRECIIRQFSLSVYIL